MTTQEILALVASGKMKPEDASKALEASKPVGKLYCKVSQAGAISVYGLQRMPVTLYDEQWDRLLGFAEEIRKFKKEHAKELSHSKEDSTAKREAFAKANPEKVAKWAKAAA